jgi:hypothetical protein
MESDNDDKPHAPGPIELAFEQHARALLELEQDVHRLGDLLEEHVRKVDRIERRQRAESSSLDAHEKRIAALEVR